MTKKDSLTLASLISITQSQLLTIPRIARIPRELICIKSMIWESDFTVEIILYIVKGISWLKAKISQ